MQVRLRGCAPLCALRLGWLVEWRGSMASAKSFSTFQRAVVHHIICSCACSCSEIEQVCRLIQCSTIAAPSLACSFAKACSQMQMMGNCIFSNLISVFAHESPALVRTVLLQEHLPEHLRRGKGSAAPKPRKRKAAAELDAIVAAHR